MAAVASNLQRRNAQYDPLKELSVPLLVPPTARKYTLQYSSLYDFRLRKLKHPKGRLLAAAKRRWTEGIYDEEEDEEVSGSQSKLKDASQASTSSSVSFGARASRKRARGPEDTPPTAHYVPRILDIKQGEICFVIGTIYCSMHLKPDVLEELTREQWLPPQPANQRYADPEKDEFFVEDESGRVRLVGDAIAADGYLRDALVTGVVVAILGTETRSGDFEVADAMFAGVPASASAPDTMDVDADAASDDDDESWVAIVSGLDVEPARSTIKMESSNETTTNGHNNEHESMMGYAEREMRLMMLNDWLLGMAGDDATEASRVTSLIIAGNSVASAPQAGEERAGGGPARNAQQQGPPPSKDSYPTSTLDDFLSDLSSSMHVHLLPGPRDPASIAMPQQPLHFALLPKSVQWTGLHRETNPAWFGIAGKRFVGTSGQNVDDVFKYMIQCDDAEARLRTACQTLNWGHLAPTAPDTISCYPLSDRDPFLIEEAPDVYFVGNQDAFATRLYKGTKNHRIRVVLVPNFSQTGCVVLVNPKTLACKLMEFGIDV